AVQNTCPEVNEFADNLPFPSAVSENQKSAALIGASRSNSQQSFGPSASAGAPKPTSTPVAAQTNEEIRSLQLR
ncbi:MAG: hypothetical protein ACTHMB_27855, partial [Candidatus Binatia bacterium]